MKRVVATMLVAMCMLAGCGAAEPRPSDPAATGNPDKPKVEVPGGKAPETLQVDDLIEGTGAVAEPSKRLRVHYVGVLYSTRKQFDATWDRATPLTFTLGVGDVMDGWDEGLVGMRVGGRRRLIVPPSQAYGARGQGVIGPNETLVFVIDLLAVS